MEGIEPSPPVPKTGALPVRYIRMAFRPLLSLPADTGEASLCTTDSTAECGALL